MSLGQYVYGYSQGGSDRAEEQMKKTSLGYQITGQGAADASEEAAAEALRGEEAKLAYLQERERLPLAFRDASMMGLAGEYGLTFDESGNIISDGSTIEERTMASPMYAAQLAAGESAIGRGASATGRLRGGATPTQLGANAQDAYLNAYTNQMRGLRDFAFGPSNTNAIAQSMGQVHGGINSRGIVAGAEAMQAGAGNVAGLGMEFVGNYAFSDPRLKSNVEVTGSYKGMDWCIWKWNKAAEALGLKGEGAGVMADQVVDIHPDCVKEIGGYLAVDYEGLENA